MDHADKTYLDVEDLQVYHKLCLLHTTSLRTFFLPVGRLS
jgi:hypothetical protein